MGFKMKILYSNKSLYPFEGGGDVSALTLLDYLSKNHDVIAVYNGQRLENTKIRSYFQKRKQLPGLWLNTYYLNKRWVKILSKIVRKEKPDLIICQDYLIPASVKVAKRFGIKSIAFLRCYIHISIDGFMTTLPEENKPSQTSILSYKLQYPFYKKVFKEFQSALKSADLVITPSPYLSEITLKYCNVKSEVIRPFVFPDKTKSDTKGEYITFFNPDIHKGLKVFEQIADRMPDRKFLVVGKDDYKTDKKNIENMGKVKNIKEVYSKTKLLLIPSIWPEGCPRVGIEAMINGIPFIVSGIGGLKEEAERGGIIIPDFHNPDEWVKAIKKLDDKEFYEKMANKAKDKSKEFEVSAQFEKFDFLLKKLIIT